MDDRKKLTLGIGDFIFVWENELILLIELGKRIDLGEKVES